MCVQADASKETGCFDLTCPGFVQTSHEIALGAAIYPTSFPSGLPYEITIYIFKVHKIIHVTLKTFILSVTHAGMFLWIINIQIYILRLIYDIN